MDDIEDLLKRYRPIGPPEDLRQRLRSATGHPVRLPLLYLLPALGTAAAALVFSVLSADIRTELAQAVRVDDPVKNALVEDLAAALGGDETARENARWIVETEERGQRDPEPSEVQVRQGA